MLVAFGCFKLLLFFVLSSQSPTPLEPPKDRPIRNHIPSFEGVDPFFRRTQKSNVTFQNNPIKVGLDFAALRRPAGPELLQPRAIHRSQLCHFPFMFMLPVSATHTFAFKVIRAIALPRITVIVFLYWFYHSIGCMKEIGQDASHPEGLGRDTLLVWDGHDVALIVYQE